MKLSLLLIFCASFITLSAQSPYELNWKKESILFGIGGTTLGTAVLVESEFVNPLEDLVIFKLDRASVRPFDRNATFFFSGNAKKGSDYLKYSSYGLPLLFLTHRQMRKDFGKIMAMYGETLLIVGGVTSLTKRIVRRPRPLVYNELVPFSDKQKNNSVYSFFSGHVSLNAGSTFFAAKVFSDYFPESKWKPVVWSAAILIPATTGYLRVKAGKHYPTDVITGFLVGGSIGLLIPHLHKKRKQKNFHISPTTTGVYLLKTF